MSSGYNLKVITDTALQGAFTMSFGSTDAAARLHLIHQRIQQACTRAGRSLGEVNLLAVSKTFPAEAVLAMAQAEQTAFGENYVQEGVDKITQLAQSPNCPSLVWHFIGPLQSNKTRLVAEHFDWVHSIDRLKIAARLSEQRPTSLKALQVLIQVNTSGEASKSGVEPEQVLELSQQLSALPNLQLRGLMTIPSNTDNSETLRDEFLTCQRLLTQLQQAGHRQADTLSMGMSADLELAIACGSTCVRVGTALFGSRTTPQNNSL